MMDKKNKRLCFFIYLALLLVTGVIGQISDFIYTVFAFLILPLIVIFAITIIILMIWISVNAYSYIFQDVLKINFNSEQKEEKSKKSANEELKEYAEKIIKQKENKK
jgi:hypothetical protein